MPKNTSPISELSASRFGGNTYVNEQVVTIGTASFTRLPNNQNRVRIAFINEGANDIRLSNTPDVTVTSGWIIAASGGVVILDWEDDGEGVSYEFYLVAVGASSNLRIREVIRS